ncbi:hypothetical protein M9H77_33780 [Catharanthus roseus]|uniref:Uncharacterized protein n=1 Tax=Catharanthus roseus TaxID=4058 RepID=A0ACB9ZK35_CATRO|nr:hypothetical protein M9H77_33780 [Catharanthus roseus]
MFETTCRHTTFVREAFQNGGSFDINLNRSLISLIPKEDAPVNISQFGPIALSNGAGQDCHQEGPRHLHSIAWPVICQPRRLGGLGLRKIERSKYGASCKLAWCNEKPSLWTQVLKGKYGTIGECQTIRRQIPLAIGEWENCWVSGLIDGMGKKPSSGL